MRFELSSHDQKANVLTIRPRAHMHNEEKYICHSQILFIKEKGKKKLLKENSSVKVRKGSTAFLGFEDIFLTSYMNK